MYTMTCISYILLLLLLLFSFEIRTVSPAANVMGVQGLQDDVGASFLAQSSLFSFEREMGGERVHFDAHTTYLVDLMGWCDVMIHPSSGFTYLEKMAVAVVVAGSLALTMAGMPGNPSPPLVDVMLGIKERFIFFFSFPLFNGYICLCFSLCPRYCAFSFPFLLLFRFPIIFFFFF